MRQKMSNGDRLPGGRSVPEELADRIVEADVSVLDKQHDPCRDELLADGADLVNGFRRCGDSLTNVRETVSSRLDDLPVLDDDK